MGERIELRADGLFHGVLGADLSLEIKRGHRLFRYDLAESLRLGRVVVVIRMLDEDAKETPPTSD